MGGQTDSTTATTTNEISRQRVRTWVDYAEAGNNPAEKAYLDCEQVCTPVVYFDAFKKYSNCAADKRFIEAVAGDEAAWYHRSWPISEANRVAQQPAHGCGGPATAWFPNGGNPDTQTFWRNWLRSKGTERLVGFSDDTSNACLWKGTSFLEVPYELGNLLSCRAIRANHIDALFRAMKWPEGKQLPIFYNGLDAVSAYQINTDMTIINLGTVVGGVQEEFVVSGRGGSTIIPRAISSTLDTISLVNNTTTKKFVLLSSIRKGNEGPCESAPHAWYQHCSEQQQRRVALATLWLGFEDGREILWDNPGSRASIGVFPEASLYPTGPLQTMTTFRSPGTNGSGCYTHGRGGAVDLLVACGVLSDLTPSGIYRREFRTCFNFGFPVGRCAVILNTTERSVAVDPSWLRQTYGHYLTMSNGDVVDAGCGNSRCPASALNPRGQTFEFGNTEVPAVDALFLFP